jgi:hypothetical protein
LLGVVGCIVLHLLPLLEIWREKRIFAKLRQEGIGFGFRDLRYDFSTVRL